MAILRFWIVKSLETPFFISIICIHFHFNWDEVTFSSYIFNQNYVISDNFLDIKFLVNEMIMYFSKLLILALCFLYWKMNVLWTCFHLMLRSRLWHIVWIGNITAANKLIYIFQKIWKCQLSEAICNCHKIHITIIQQLCVESNKCIFIKDCYS